MRFGKSKAKKLGPREAADALARGELVLVDVREPQERTKTRVEGSLHIPLGQLAERLGELPQDRPVAFICHSGRRSASAAAAASKQGLEAANVRGGLVAWSDAGLPLDAHREPRTGPEGVA
jgi:rhodanese-related sulfurtransferase